METTIFIIIALLIYFIPSVIAWNSKYASGILILNIFLGWTLIGWVGALIWAVSAPRINKNQTFGSGTHKRNINIKEGLISIRNLVLVKTSGYVDPEVKQLQKRLNPGEAIVKNKLTESYEIFTAERWEDILAENSQDEFEIIEEK